VSSSLAPSQMKAPSAVRTRPDPLLFLKVMSGRKMIGASRPLAPWAVMTRTSRAPSDSISRFTSTSSRSRSAAKASRLRAPAISSSRVFSRKTPRASSASRPSRVNSLWRWVRPQGPVDSRIPTMKS